jgi:hypothetical protein
MKSAMLQAVKDGHLFTWPVLTEDTINKHLKLTQATAMGHMNQRRQNIRSTSKAPIEKQPKPDTDLGTKTHLVYAVVVDQAQLYSDGHVGRVHSAEVILGQFAGRESL